MHLASDAVRAAADSPFLEGVLPATAGVLCCVSMPPAAAVLGGAGADDRSTRALQVRGPARGDLVGVRVLEPARPGPIEVANEF